MLVFVLLRLEGNSSIINVLDEECKTGLVIIVSLSLRYKLSQALFVWLIKVMSYLRKNPSLDDMNGSA